MKHIVKEFDVYNFDELSVEAQQRAIENERTDAWRLDYDWYDWIFEEFTKKYEAIGIKNPKLAFNLSFSQGDYARLSEGEIDVKIVLKDIFPRHNLKQFMTDFTEAYITNNKVCLEVFYDYNNSYPYIISYLERLVNRIEKELNNKIDSLNQQLYDALAEEYLELQSDEYISNELIENEVLFYKNGDVYMG